MISEKDLVLPLALLNRVYDALDAIGQEGVCAPGDSRKAYPLVLDMLEMAISEIDRRSKEGAK